MKSWLVSIVIGTLNLYRKFTENDVKPKSVRHHYFNHVNTNLNNEIFETLYKLQNSSKKGVVNLVATVIEPDRSLVSRIRV